MRILVTLDEATQKVEETKYVLNLMKYFTNMKFNINKNDKISKKFLTDYHNNIIREILMELNSAVCLDANTLLTDELYVSLQKRNTTTYNMRELTERYETVQILRQQIAYYEEQNVLLNINSKHFDAWPQFYKDYVTKYLPELTKSTETEEDDIFKDFDTIINDIISECDKTKSKEIIENILSKVKIEDIKNSTTIKNKCVEFQNALAEICLTMKRFLNTKNLNMITKFTPNDQMKLQKIQKNISELCTLIEAVYIDGHFIIKETTPNVKRFS